MLNQEILQFNTTPIEPLVINQKVKDALYAMEITGVAMLPVVAEDGDFKGLIFEEDLLDADPGSELSALTDGLKPIFVLATDHFLNTARLQNDQQLDVIPVLDEDHFYIGAITPKALLMQFCKMTGVQIGGALIVLSIAPKDYSISQLARLVETNDAFITQLNTSPDEENGQLLVTLRLNKMEISDIISTLQRYEYVVIFTAGLEDYENEIRRNYNHLMNYLEM